MSDLPTAPGSSSDPATSDPATPPPGHPDARHPASDPEAIARPPSDTEAVRHLFDAALEREPRARGEFLQRACRGNDALRGDVERLLAVFERRDGVLAPYEQHVRGSRIHRRGDASLIAATDSLLGRQIGQYQILDRIGGGGMGDVYKARDTKLERLAALKFLPLTLTRDAEAEERFIQEARAASMLDSPHIAVVFEIDEAPGGQLYIAMAYYDGEPLKRRIARGPLQVDDALDFAVQIGKGLAAAHQRGIIHRDVKPANLIVTRSAMVKIVDFGLAKMTDVSLTRTGTTLGTIAYMSPEQARGDEVDQRADIWSLGVVLFEMLTGERPFRGAHQQAVIYSILTEEPDSVSDLQPGIPPAVDGIIRRLLRKNPEERYAHAEEVIADIEAVREGRGVVASPLRRAYRPARWRYAGVGLAGAVLVLALALSLMTRRTAPQDEVSTALPIASIAVLPTANHSGDPEQEYLADGIHDALIGELARIGALRVISRTSMLRYRGSELTVPEIAGELDVDAIVEASLFRADDSVRIQVQLIQATPVEHHLWAQTYDRPFQDVPILHATVAQAIAHRIDVALTPEEERRFEEARSIDPEAYEDYLRGRFYLLKLAPDNYEIAFRYFEAALEKDPDYARPYAGIALLWAHRGLWGGVPPLEANEKLQAAASRALELDDELGEAHMVHAIGYYCYEWDWHAARAGFHRAIELDPGDPQIRLFYGDFLLSMNEADVAIEQMDRALEVDPLNPFAQTMRGWALLTMRRYDEAILQLQTALRVEPNLFLAVRCLWTALHMQGRFDEALAQAQIFYRAQDLPEIAAELARVPSGEAYEEAYRVAAERLSTGAQEVYVPSMHVARLFMLAGDVESSLDWLERAYEERYPSVFSMNVDPHWDLIRDHPRFLQLLTQMDLAVKS